MIRRTVPILLTGLILLGGLAIGDEPTMGDKDDPPLRLKRKKRTTDPATKEPDKAKTPTPSVKDKPKEEEPLTPEDARPGAGESADDDKEILERIRRNMHAVEEKLGNRELGDPISQQQRDILRDIDSLIKKSEQQSSGGGGGADNQQQDQNQEPDQQGEKGGSKQKQSGNRAGSAGGAGNGPRRMARSGGRRQPRPLRGDRGREKGASGQEMAGGPMRKPGSSPSPANPGTNPGTGGNGAESSREINLETYKDVWGHLPESLRAEMNEYSNPRPFMPRYDRLIREYYRTIAEQGRKKGD